MATKNKSNEIHITRIYDAPVKMVWNAWTDPKQTAQWWGPRGFTLTTHSKDLKVGGHWRYTMHGPDGVDYENHTIYHEVEKYSRLVYDHGGFEDRPPLFRVDVQFKELKNKKTQMDMRMILPTPEAAQETKKFVKAAGGNGTWDRLAEFLEKEETGKEKFIINRSFEAPIETVYEMWTNPEHISQWLPPTGFTMKYLRADVSPNGSSFYLMTNGDVKMYGKINYKEFHRPDLIVYTQEFCDENEKPSHHPMLPTWPAIMWTRVSFAVENDNETRVTVEWRPDDKASKEEIEVFVKQRAGMTQGWTGSFDKFEEYIKNK